MRISDWSSDVCSSDLRSRTGRASTGVCAYVTRRRLFQPIHKSVGRNAKHISRLLPDPVEKQREGTFCAAEFLFLGQALLSQLVIFIRPFTQLPLLRRARAIGGSGRTSRQGDESNALDPALSTGQPSPPVHVSNFRRPK